VRPDAIIATGRSDYPNQVNNVLCFPFIFRGALDAGATKINEEMKLACVKAIAELAEAEQSDVVAQAYGGADLLRPELPDSQALRSAPDRQDRAVAQAAIDSGVATRKIDMDAYVQSLNEFVYQSGIIMKPVFTKAKALPPTRARALRRRGERARAACRACGGG
jgi:malate dehydrogenase (oxaloacetate-decarboxylating)(NADP+)